jgi:hypothetical protein
VQGLVELFNLFIERRFKRHFWRKPLFVLTNLFSRCLGKICKESALPLNYVAIARK